MCSFEPCLKHSPPSLQDTIQQDIHLAMHWCSWQKMHILPTNSGKICAEWEKGTTRIPTTCIMSCLKTFECSPWLLWGAHLVPCRKMLFLKITVFLQEAGCCNLSWRSIEILQCLMTQTSSTLIDGRLLPQK